MIASAECSCSCAIDRAEVAHLAARARVVQERAEHLLAGSRSRSGSPITISKPKPAARVRSTASVCGMAVGVDEEGGRRGSC